jgi:hypothetical protein
MRNRSSRAPRHERLPIRRQGLVDSFGTSCKPSVPEPFEGALDQLQARIEYWRQELNLCGWQVTGRWVDDDESWTARITIKDDFHLALMEVGTAVEEREWDWVVVHELVHLILWPTSALMETMCEHLDRHQSEILEDLITNAEEAAVNRLTEAIVGKRLPVVWKDEEE